MGIAVIPIFYCLLFFISLYTGWTRKNGTLTIVNIFKVISNVTPLVILDGRALFFNKISDATIIDLE